MLKFSDGGLEVSHVDLAIAVDVAAGLARPVGKYFCGNGLNVTNVQ